MKIEVRFVNKIGKDVVLIGDSVTFYSDGTVQVHSVPDGTVGNGTIYPNMRVCESSVTVKPVRGIEETIKEIEAIGARMDSMLTRGRQPR
jgi:hypothetical protein